MKTESKTYGTSSARSSFPVSLLLLAAVLWLVPACATGAEAVSETQDTPGLTVFFTSDTRGLLRRCGCSEGQSGGISARASFIKANANPGRTLVLDAGDSLFDGLERKPGRESFRLLKAGTIVKSMTAAGTDATAVGEFDLADGTKFLQEASGGSGFPFLSANLMVCHDGGNCKQPFPASVVKEVGGIKVGIIGLLDERFPYADFPANFSGIKVSAQTQAAERLIGELSDKADIIIVLAHESITDVSALTKGLQGADVIIQGHSQEQLEEPLKVGNAIVLKGYTMAKHIGRLDIWLSEPDCSATGRVARYEFSETLLDESIPPDLEVERIISGFRLELKARAMAGGGEMGHPEGYVGPAVCGECHAAQLANWSATAHAHAFSSLENTSDQYDPDCLPCHTTGYVFEEAAKKPVDGGEIIPYKHKGMVNVTCESCHGAGAGHVSVKKGQTPEDGLADTVRMEVPEELCMGCHDDANSPYFSYEQYKEMGGAHRPASPVN